MSSNIKTFPCIGTAQTLVAAALALAPKLNGRHNQIRRIEAIMAQLPMIVNQQAEITRKDPRSREDADHSFTFLPAVALVDGALTEDQFANNRCHPRSSFARPAACRRALRWNSTVVSDWSPSASTHRVIRFRSVVSIG